MDIIFIKDLRVDAIIGIYEWERRVKQTISIDLQMGTDIARAARSDKISDTLDYKAVSKRIIALVAQSEYELVEALAETLAATIMAEFKVPWLQLTLAKPGAVRGAQSVGVIIERGSKS